MLFPFLLPNCFLSQPFNKSTLTLAIHDNNMAVLDGEKKQ